MLYDPIYKDTCLPLGMGQGGKQSLANYKLKSNVSIDQNMSFLDKYHIYHQCIFILVLTTYIFGTI